MDTHLQSGQAFDPDAAPRPGRRWWSSLWLWPAVAIGLAVVAGTVFGPIGAILGGEAVAAVTITTGILALSRERWLTLGLSAVLVVSLGAIAGSILWYESDHKSSHRNPSAPAARGKSPVDWQWRTITQAMANGADLRGADLDGANLNGLQLSRKNFEGVQADGASLRGSQLQGASLQGASLRGACLQGANLTGANLAGADFTGADVAGVTVSRQAKQAALAWPSARSAPAPACS